MPTYYKYEKYLKYINGVPQDEYKQGELVGTGEYSSKADCEEGAIYRWVNTDKTVCDGYDLHSQEVKQKSTDNGETWTNTNETRTGEVIEKWSESCGVVKKYEWRPSGQTRCHSFSTESEYVYLVSYTMGTTWEDVLPRQTKWEVSDAFSDECFTEAIPFTFTYDAGDEGGQLDLSNVIMNSLYSYWSQNGPYDDPHDVYKKNMYYEANIITKYAIDWGDGIENFNNIKYTSAVSKYDVAGEHVFKDPFININLTNPIKLTSHIYRTGGIKTIKIWGNISLFQCDKVKEIIHWGTNMTNARLSIDNEFLLKNLNDKGIVVCDTSGYCFEEKLIEARVEPWTNFNKVVILNYQGTELGTMYSFLFNYLKYFDISNSPNMIYPNPYSSFNLGHLQTFIADNCASLQSTPYLDYLGFNDNTSKLTEISFKNCPNLKYVNPIEMYHVPSSGGAYTRGLNLTSGYTYNNGVFENCLNIEVFDFKYDVYVGSIDFRPYTKLKRITGNLIKDYIRFTNYQALFYLFCKGLQELEDIDNLVLKGGCFYEAFKDCPKIKHPCTTIIDRVSDYGYVWLELMYENTGIKTLDISKIYLSNEDPSSVSKIILSNMFANCKELTTITGLLLDNLNVENYTFQAMFKGCSKLTTISSMFKNKTYLPDLDYMFKDCDIRSIPNDIFNASYEADSPIIPLYMFENNVNLSNYPVFNGLPMWKMSPFFFSEITKALTFCNCPLITAEVPREWGGYANVTPTKLKIVIPVEHYNFEYRGTYNTNMSSVLTIKSDGATEPSAKGKLFFPSPGTYTLELYNTSYYDDLDICLPEEATEIIDWGEATNIDSRSFEGYPYYNPIGYFKITKYPYGRLLFSLLGIYNDGNLGDYDMYCFNIKNITDVDDNLLLNCGNNITKIAIERYNEYKPRFNMCLTEDKYTKMLSYLTKLTEIHKLFDWDNKVIATFTTTCGIFKNNPGLTDIRYALYGCKLTTIPIDEFSNNTELTNVSYLFKDSTNLTNMPNFNENKKITNFTYAFDGCINLKGSTPVDENGYKLWERAGKEGYPSQVNGQHCFRGCTQLDDYDEIPDFWK